MDKGRNSSAFIIAAGIFAFVVICILTSVTVQRGELNQDEGWYLYGAGLISGGQRPYIDFATTQGPVMQYVYSFFWVMVEKWGVLGGRILTALFGIISIIFSAGTAARMLKPSKRALGSLIVLCLAGLNVYQLYFFSIVKTYALASAFISASFFLLTFAGRRRHVCAFTAGILIMLAVGTRMSAGAMMPAVLLWLFIDAGGSGERKKDLRWLAYGAGAGLCMAALFVPFILKAPECVKFAMFEYHAGRSGGGLGLAYKGGFLARLVRAYYPAMIALVGVGLYGVFGKSRADHICQTKEGKFASMLLGAVLLVTILHLAAPFPYDDYQAMVFPVFCAGLVVAGAGLLPEERQGRAALCVLIAGILFAGASPLNEQMFIGKRDRIWWPMRAETSLQKLDRAAEFIEARAGSRMELLTQDLYIAVEAGMMVPKGFELGPFCYFPDWPREKAEKRHVLNDEMMREILQASTADVAALSGYGLAIKAPEIVPCQTRSELVELMEQNYETVEKIIDFGQAETELLIMMRKKQ